MEIKSQLDSWRMENQDITGYKFKIQKRYSLKIDTKEIKVI